MINNTEEIMKLANKLAVDSAKAGVLTERLRIIKLLVDLNAIRRDALGHWVAVNTDATETVYLDGLEPND
jgi:hypothetical protein